jgi:hypothetical protein
MLNFTEVGPMRAPSLSRGAHWRRAAGKSVTSKPPPRGSETKAPMLKVGVTRRVFEAASTFLPRAAAFLCRILAHLLSETSVSSTTTAKTQESPSPLKREQKVYPRGGADLNCDRGCHGESGAVPSRTPNVIEVDFRHKLDVEEESASQLRAVSSSVLSSLNENGRQSCQ